MIALLEAQRAGLITRATVWRDIVAGIVVGVVAMPLAMAFAIASGAKPEQGLYTAIVAGIATAVLGGTRVQISGPTGAFIAVLAGITAQYGIAGLQIATLMAGLILLAMGLIRLGGVIRYIPDPVIVGFTSGIGVIIWVGQWKDFFGLHPSPAGTHFHEKLWALLQALPGLDLATTAIAVGTLLVTILGARMLPRIPGLRRLPSPLLAMLLATGVQALWRFPTVATIGTAFGGIPRALPGLALPAVSVSQVLQLIGPAFTIALLGAIESLLTAVVADGMTGARHDSNQELIGQGIANVLSPLFGGFAATGAIARTATNIRNGATSPIAGIVHGVLLVLIIVLLAPWAAAIPLAALAAILFTVAWNMSDVPHFVGMLRRAATADRLLLAVTFVLTVFVDLVVGVNVGVMFAALLFMKRMSETVRIEQQAFTGAEDASRPQEEQVLLPPDVLVYRIEGPFFFGAAEKLERVLERTPMGVASVVLRFGRVPFMDITGMQTLAELIRRFRKHGMRVVFCGVHDSLRESLQAAEVLGLLGEENLCANMGEVAARLRAA
ncbi:MAG TPA: SulP family inorganic anion transporter [Steroidobacteraceae bacterium]|nr:SulP family inorganic anion transporter [Steroidobacteraceae bacterium]